MKAALIPPNSELEHFGRGDLHLLLAHLCANKTYFTHYHTQRRTGSYLILDNSAHEYGSGVDEVQLAVMAKRLQVQEVVVPDVLDNGTLTVERAVNALETWYESSSTLMRDLGPTLMYVPQGSSVEEYYTCLHELVGLHLYISKKRGLRRNFVLGISKDYEAFPGGLDAILQYAYEEKALLQKDHGVNIQVHILGWSRRLWALNDLAKRHKWVRSTDSAKPFVYALNNVLLDPSSPPPAYPGRHPVAYFKKKLSAFQYDYAVQNVEVFVKAARGEL